ncbi:MAG: outer membrane protein assembly factor BamA [Acidobacteriota bacterium]|nr:outer membrane protein assembly factor BamA [Acidobacteriota bacterium]
MKFFRPQCLTAIFVCVQGLMFLVPVRSQTPPPAQQKKANPFEVVPQGAEPVKPPAAPAPPAPPVKSPGGVPPAAAPNAAGNPAASASPATAGDQNVIAAIEFRGSRRVPQDTLRALIFSRVGDTLNDETLRRDFIALWNTGRFDDIKLEAEPSDKGQIIRFIVTERPVIRTIKYENIKSLTTSEILDRFKERKVGLTVESQYDPNKVQRAAVVIKEYLSERGRQFAIVDPVVRRVPPSSLEVIFNVNEGPKVKVGTITILGNEVFSSKDVIRAMKNSKPIGIPYSILFENLFARTYDATKLEEDKERVRDAYQQKGYYMAKVLDQKVDVREVPGGKRVLPFFFIKTKPGKRADLTVPVEEGHQFRLHKINYVGVKLFRTPEVLSQRLFKMDNGDIFSTAKLRDGIKNLTKLYGDFGYIDFVPEPAIEVVPNTDTVDMTLTADEGKQFFVRRIDFTGNTTTRDKVIRREILLDEGDIYSSRLWDASILRLNQLGYFETLKENESYELKRNPGSNTVDILLKVKEKGKNSIGLNGGVSGIAGSFVGFNYSTNNFLGLGETLSLESQLGTRTREVSAGFTEPHVLDTQILLGFNAYIRRYNYDQARESSILSGRDLRAYYDALGNQNLLNYVQSSRGISLSASYPLRRSFARLGLTYGYDISDLTTKSLGAQNYFQYLYVNQVSGPNALQGVKTSRIVPSYSYNSKNHPLTPTAGKSIFFSVDFAGSFLGGTVNTVRPSLDLQYYHASPKWHKNVLAFHTLASTYVGYGGKVIPPYSRTYIGGENDVRGFDFYGISPIAFIPSSANVNVLNVDGTPRVQKVIGSDGLPAAQAVTQQIPIYQVITPGGDTQVVGNFEYRIPIFGPVTMAPFFDIGLNKILYKDQLRLNQSRIDELNGLFPQAAFNNKVQIAPGTENIRMSTGLEIQVLLPIVQAPFRIYYALNPSRVYENLQTPIVADRSYFPNNASFLNAIANYGRSYPFFEKRGTFRFTIGRTF